MSTTVTKQGLGKMHVWYLHRFLLFRNARQNELSSWIPIQCFASISFLMELKALTQKCLILDISNADPDLPFATVLSNQEIGSV